MGDVERLIGMLLIAAARDAVLANRLLGRKAPEGYFYVWGAVVWDDAPGWVSGLWGGSP